MKKIFFLLVFGYTILAIAQDRLNVEKLGFSFSKPKNWYVIDENEETENIKKYNFSDEQLKNIISGVQSINIAIFTKYDVKKTGGIIPTIKIKTEQNPTKNNKSFLEFISRSYENFSKQLDNFKIIKKPIITTVSNQTAVYSEISFTLKIGESITEVKTISYTIPRGKYCITINFIEENNKEDNSIIYNNLLKSIILK